VPVVGRGRGRGRRGLWWLQDSPGEEGVALPVVLVLAAGGAVEGLAVKELGAIDEVHLDAGVGAAVEDGGEAAVSEEGDGDVADGVVFFGGLLLGIFADLAVVRDEDGDFVAEGGGSGAGGCGGLRRGRRFWPRARIRRRP